MTELSNFLESIFPAYLHDDAIAVSKVITPSQHAPTFDADHDQAIRTVRVGSDTVNLVRRVYNPEVDPEIFWKNLTATQRNMLSCFYSRSHNGYLRERYLNELMKLEDDWVAPFVMQLIGEYVIETAIIINNASAQLLAKNSYLEFIKNNSEFLTLLRQRATSYWDCWHRSSYPDLSSYPGIQFLDACKATVSR